MCAYNLSKTSDNDYTDCLNKDSQNSYHEKIFQYQVILILNLIHMNWYFCQIHDMEVIISEATYSNNKGNALSSCQNNARNFQNLSTFETGLSKFHKIFKIEDKSLDIVFIFALVFLIMIGHILKIYLYLHIKSISCNFFLSGNWIIDTVNTKSPNHFQPELISEM